MRRRTPLRAETIEPHMCSVELRLHVLRQVPFFASLTDEEVAEVNRLAREQGYEVNETIYFSGDPAGYLYVVAAGKVKLLRHAWSGQDVLIDILMPGEFFGTLATPGEKTYAETAQAQTTCCVLALQADDFKAILRRYPSVALAVLDIVAERLAAARTTIHQLSAHPVEQRVAAVLLKLAEKLGEEHNGSLLIQMPLSRQDLADMTGTTTETVSRIMSQFRQAGLIDSGRQWIAVTDRAVLTRMAEEIV